MRGERGGEGKEGKERPEGLPGRESSVFFSSFFLPLSAFFVSSFLFFLPGEESGNDEVMENDEEMMG